MLSRSSDGSAGAGVIAGLLLGLEIPPPLKPSGWAGEHYVIGGEAAEPGRWSADRAAYQPGMMDVFAEDGIREIVFMTSAQVGKTTVFIIVIGYIADHAPAPILFIQPTLDMVENFSKERLDPAIRDCPRLNRLFPPPRSRDGDNTQKRKAFPGGYVALAGANSPTSLRMRAVKFVMADEVDAYPASVGDEGDPIELARKRTRTFWNSKLLAASTPKHKVTSKIARLFEESDKRYFLVPCPECGHEQKIEWKCKENGEAPANIKWEKGKPQTAYYVCEKNGCALDDADLKLAVRKGRWEKTATSNGIAGFHLSELYSPFSSLGDIVEQFERAVGFTDRMQTFWNTVLGLPWEGEVIGSVDAKTLYGRREKYPANEMPARAALMTAAVDVQHDRLELMPTAWGLHDERWVMEKLVLQGDPNGPKVWKECEEMLLRQYRHPSGRIFPIEAAALDTGGAHTQKVYDFCVRNILAGRLWWPIKGMPGTGRPLWKRSDVRIKHGVHLFGVGVDGGKASVYAALAISEQNAPNYVHVPISFEMDHFERMTVEKCKVSLDKHGFPQLEWHRPDGAANEELDLMVYNLAARASINVDMAARLEALGKPMAPALDPRALARRLKKHGADS